MGRKVQVEVFVDSSYAERGFAKTSQAAQKFDRDLSHTVRGVVSGSNAFQHLGRSLAFASGGFLAAQGITDFLKSSVDAARSVQTTQKSLAAQLAVSGESFKQWGTRIDQADLSLARFGFNSLDAEKAMVTLVRATGSAQKAISLQGLVANLARAKNEDLATAALTVGKVFSGQTTALRRAVPGLERTAKGMDLIRDAAAKLQGQAAANTTVVDRFNATLHDTKVIVGTALLPTVNRYLSRLDDWLAKMNRSGRLQRDVNEAVRTARQVLSGVAAIVKPLANEFKQLGDAVGGTKNEVEILVAAFAAFKLSKIASQLGLVAGGVKGIGSSAELAAGQVGTLRSRLASIAGKTFAAAVILDLIPRSGKGQNALNQLGLGALGHAPVLGGAATQSANAGLALGGAIKSWLPGIYGPQGGGNPNSTAAQMNALRAQKNLSAAEIPTSFSVAQVRALQKNFANAGQFNLALQAAFAYRASTAGTPISRLSIPDARGRAQLGPKPLTAEQQLQLALSASPNDIGLLRQQAAHDRSAVAFAAKLRARGSIDRKTYVAEVLGYNNDLQSTLNTISSLTAAAAAKTAEERKKAVAAAKKAAARAALERGETLTEAFALPRVGRAAGGLFADLARSRPRLGGGVVLAGQYSTSAAFQLAEAKANALGDQASLVALAYRERAAAMHAIRSHRLSLQALIQAWNIVGQANQTIGQAVKNAAVAASSRMLTAGLGLATDVRKALESRLALAGAFSGHVPVVSGVLGQSVPMVNVGAIHVHTDDPHKVADVLGKLGRSKPVQTSGPNAGRSRALP